MGAPVTRHFVRYEKVGRTAVVTIDRPEVLNALHAAANEELFDVWSEFAADQEMWTAILTGAGERAFCVGADITQLPPPEKRVPSSVREKSDSRTQFGGLVHREIWKPIIAAVRGYCLGGGLELALACDLVIAAEDARFGLPEVRQIGGFPSAGGVHRAPRQLPLKVAMHMLLTGDPITAVEAQRFGLVNNVVRGDELLPEALRLAARINGNAPMGVRVIKEMVTRSLDLPLEYPAAAGEHAWGLEDNIATKLWRSEDWRSREGRRAFLEKRPPVWKGR